MTQPATTYAVGRLCQPFMDRRALCLSSGLVDGSGRRRLSSLIVERGAPPTARRSVREGPGACDEPDHPRSRRRRVWPAPDIDTGTRRTLSPATPLRVGGRSSSGLKRRYRIVTARGDPDESIFLTRAWRSSTPTAGAWASWTRGGRGGPTPVPHLITSRARRSGGARPLELIDRADTDGLHLTVPPSGSLTSTSTAAERVRALGADPAPAPGLPAAERPRLATLGPPGRCRPRRACARRHGGRIPAPSRHSAYARVRGGRLLRSATASCRMKPLLPARRVRAAHDSRSPIPVSHVSR